MITEEWHSEMSLSDWQRMLRGIYFSTQNYRRPAFELFTHLVKVFGGGSQFLLRTNNPDGSREFLAKIFAWYCALATRLEIDIEDALWQKYPGICPRCQDSVCGCGSPPKPIDEELLAIYSIERRDKRPATLRQWQAMFGNMYRGPSGKEPVPATRDRLALVFSRIGEELGEVAEGLLLDGVIDKDSESVLKNEIADVGAWIFALANNLQYVDMAATGVTLADVAWSMYPSVCHRCREKRCVCVNGSYSLELAEKGAMGPSHWDELTGLANSKALVRFLTFVQQEFKAGKHLCSVIFLDLDNFGAVNKEHGHSAGDHVLAEAAKRIKTAVGTSGLAFRRGGEEFVVVVRSPADKAGFIAEQIRRELNHAAVEVTSAKGSASVSVTASIGVANCMTDSCEPKDLEALAEGRAREAKSTGKNRVIPVVSRK